MPSIKVFISHASEDKDRFVLDFAKRLRTNNIDAWIDIWEMLPGDLLVEKVFEFGLKQASVVVIVLSKYSVNKPWVKEEINTAFIKRISGQCKLIPVIIDECEIPTCLLTTVWEKISDLSSYDESYKRIELAILGKTDKPLLGESPRYARENIERIADLSEQDSLIFKLTSEICIETSSKFTMAYNVIQKGIELGLSNESVLESLEILGQNGLLTIPNRGNSPLFSMSMTVFGLGLYYQHYRSSYSKEIKDISFLLVNKDIANNDILCKETKLPKFLVDHILDLLESNGLINTSKAFGGYCYITRVSASLKRKMQSEEI